MVKPSGRPARSYVTPAALALPLAVLALACALALVAWASAAPGTSQAAGLRAPAATATWQTYLAYVSNVPPPEPTPVGEPGNWHLVFRDEFAANTVDPSRWVTCYPWANPQAGCTNAGNSELQWYLPDGVSVNWGSLKLNAQRRTVTGTNGQVYHYTSGMLSSGASPGQPARFTYTYGFAEARLKLPAGRGFWPAFWTLPLDQAWPPEVDGMEAAGSQPTLISMNVHWTDGSGLHQQSQSLYTGPDFTAGWHTIGVSWTPASMVWYVDGVARKTFTNVTAIPAEPMYLLLNLAIDGSDPPDGTTPFPGIMEVDYVRVWQH